MRAQPPTALKIAAGVAAPILIAALVFWLSQWQQVVAVTENWSQDIRVALITPAVPQHPDIVVLTITERTLATLPVRSPIDRDFLADLLETLKRAGVRAVGLDILFDQPTIPDQDERLRKLLREFPVPLVAVWADRSDGLTAGQSEFLEDYLDGVGRGQAALLKDPHDDVVRWMPAPRATSDSRVPGFSAAMAESLGVTAPETSAPLIYRGRPDTGAAPFASFEAHTAHLLPPTWLSGKIVLIGADLPDADRFRTPRASVFGALGATTPGVFIHAHGLAELLDGRLLPEIAPWMDFLIVLSMTLVGFLIAALEIPAAAQIVFGAASVGVFWGIGFVLFGTTGAQIPLAAPSLAFAVAAAASSTVIGARHRKQKRFIKNAFSHYVAPEVVSSLVADPQSLELGGEKRELTLVFTDIAAFTTLAEEMEPTDLVPMLNAYLDGMSRIVLDHGGTIDKFVGDAVVALFGAPSHVDDHAPRTVSCAMALDAFARRFAGIKRTEGVPFGATRIGVHTGTAVVGNFGGAARFDYTAIGDAVNVAARLEGANKIFGTTICVSGACVERCPGQHFRPMGDLVLKGRTRPTRMFEPLSDDRAKDAATQAYNDAFESLASGDDGAPTAFADLHASKPDDALIAFHHRRLSAGERDALIVMEEK